MPMISNGRRHLFTSVLMALCLLNEGCLHRVGQDSDLLDGNPNLAVGLVASRLEKIEQEVETVVRQFDEALWKHWTVGAPLNLHAIRSAHASLFSSETLATIRKGRSLGAGDQRVLAHLEHWLMSELLSRDMADENQIVANLRASATFSADGKEYEWRELQRLLTTEPSAQKRRSLWVSSTSAAKRIAAALDRREQKLQSVFAKFEIPSELEFASESREVDVEALAQLADDFLKQSDQGWRSIVTRLGDRELMLPYDALTPSDLPRLLRPPPSVDAAFPKDRMLQRARDVIAAFRLGGSPRIALEISDEPKTHPLPLVVAPAPGDVRLHFRASGGLRDQVLMMEELGTATALWHTSAQRLANARLGDPSGSMILSDLLAGLLADRLWLATMGVSQHLQANIQESVQALRLYKLRRAAATILLKLETSGTDATIVARALGVKPLPDDMLRWDAERDELLRAMSHFKSALLAESLRQQLGPRFWEKEEAHQRLQKIWSQGTQTPIEQRIGAMKEGLTPLIHALCGPVPNLNTPN